MAAASAVQPAAAPAASTTTVPGCGGVEGQAPVFGGRRTFLLDGPTMIRLKDGIRPKGGIAGDPALAGAYRRLLARAEAALGRGPYSVTDKPAPPPSGDRHDYISVGPYWWPDPARPGGLPYVRRDGEMNPARSGPAFDVQRLQDLSDDVGTLALAYYYSDDARFARHAAALLRAWFLDPATRMNPNLDFAQSIPGRVAGRAEGIIDTARLQRVVDAIGLIGPSGALAPADQAGLERWFGDYVQWMRRSANGRKEDAAVNNHSIWYDAQLAQFALFARRPDIALAVAKAFPERRIVPQFEPDGRLPRELTRTRSLHYSVFALQAAYDVADLGRCVGQDIWHFRDKDGRGLRSATAFVAGYAGRLDRWPYPEMRPEPGLLDDLLLRASAIWPADHPGERQAALLRRYFGEGDAPAPGAPAAAH